MPTTKSQLTLPAELARPPYPISTGYLLYVIQANLSINVALGPGSAIHLGQECMYREPILAIVLNMGWQGQCYTGEIGDANREVHLYLYLTNLAR